MRFLQPRRVHFVVLGDGPMNAVGHRLGLAWQMCDAKRSLPTFDTGPRGIDDISHGLLLSELDKLESAAQLKTLFVLNTFGDRFRSRGRICSCQVTCTDVGG